MKIDQEAIDYLDNLESNRTKESAEKDSELSLSPTDSSNPLNKLGLLSNKDSTTSVFRTDNIHHLPGSNKQCRV